MNLENLATAYVELTRNGIATAESTTYINSMLNELGDSGKAVGKILQEQTGKSFGQLMHDGWSLADVLDVLLKSVDGNTEALMGLWGSQEAGKAANAIVSQSLEDFNGVLAQMNAEMAGTTGTTEQAYETMTSTSEFIDRRLTNSVKNLAISYGEMLAPPMDAIKTLGADILDGLAELINQSPAAASAIAAVSTGVAVLAGGLAALMIVEKVKAAFGGFNALLAANPALLVVAGISALAIGISTLIANTKEENKYLEEFNTKLNDMKGELDHSVAAAEVAADQVGAYVARLKELEAAGLKTTEEQAEYHAILVKLTQTIPELSDMRMRCKVDFSGSYEDRTMGQSAFEALFQGMDPVKIDVLDGFWYNAVLLSADPSDTSHDAMTTVDYEFRVTRHKEPVTIRMDRVNNIYCISNVERTDCIITIAAGYFGGEYDAGLQLDLGLNGYCWSIQGSDNPDEEAIILDGVNKRFLIGSTNVTQKIGWTDFPYLIPGENQIIVSVNGGPQVLFIGNVAYTPTFA